MVKFATWFVERQKEPGPGLTLSHGVKCDHKVQAGKGSHKVGTVGLENSPWGGVAVVGVSHLDLLQEYILQGEWLTDRFQLLAREH